MHTFSTNNIRNRDSSVLLEADPYSVWRAEGRVRVFWATGKMVMQNDKLLKGDELRRDGMDIAMIELFGGGNADSVLRKSINACMHACMNE